jgi:two-component system chemotaxis sensor kinase CheA
MDPEVLAAFLDESEESLQTVDLGFVTLESQPKDLETINAIFRAIHSIKGNSPFFGLMVVKRLAHQMEDLLALMREQVVQAGHAEISCLLAGLDLLKGMLRNVRAGEPELRAGEEGALEAALSSIKAAAVKPAEAPETWQEVWRQLDGLGALTGAAEITGAVSALRRTLLRLAPAGEAPAVAQRASVSTGGAASAEPSAPAGPSAPRSGSSSSASHVAAAGAPDLHDILAELEQILTPVFDDVLASAGAQRVRELLVLARDRSAGPERGIADRALGEHDSMLAAVGFVPILRETLLERIAEIRAGAATSARSANHRPDRAAPVAARDKAEVSRTMRVEEAKIDEFLDYVGELIITREMFGNVGKRLRMLERQSGLSTEFQRAMGAFTALSHNLQRSIMEIRKVPVKFVLQKVPRLVRDIADQAGKQAVVTLVGNEITVDKSLIESFEAPLVHMVRNAVDHGLETPDERLRRGKPAAGKIEVAVTETSAEFICAIRDDGGGINVEALRDKAVRLGLLTERAAAQLSRTEAYQLIFAAGLSTAKQITDVSGRGVGMDVVKRNVTDLGGRIEIESEPARGSTFTIYLPKAVTVQILDGFLVQVGKERLVLPLRAISESFRPTLDQLHTIAERGECVSRRGRVFPLVRFNRLLALGADDRCPSEAIVVSVEVSGGRSAGLLVDQVLGVQQVVLREVAGIDTSVQVFAGGAVLGDGRVAMVVDVEKLGALVARVAEA